MTIVEPRRVGFWAPPRTRHDNIFGSVLGALLETILPLPRAEDCIDLSWDHDERAVVLAYVDDRVRHGMGYMGSSLCRICFCHNGCADFTDGLYIWPEGFGHYIKEHGVKPPQHFIDHALSRTHRT